MSDWLTRCLERIRRAVRHEKVRFTLKALGEMEDLGVDEEDVLERLAKLRRIDFVERVRSDRGHEWLYVFKPLLGEMKIYLKVAIRVRCIVISFHEDRLEN